jgi:hypothetical protein
MRIEAYKKKSGKPFFRVVSGNIFNKKIHYISPNRQACELYIKKRGANS